jgi:hypothetical protein
LVPSKLLTPDDIYGVLLTFESKRCGDHEDFLSWG